MAAIIKSAVVVSLVFRRLGGCRRFCLTAEDHLCDDKGNRNGSQQKIKKLHCRSAEKPVLNLADAEHHARAGIQVFPVVVDDFGKAPVSIELPSECTDNALFDSRLTLGPQHSEGDRDQDHHATGGAHHQLGGLIHLLIVKGDPVAVLPQVAQQIGAEAACGTAMWIPMPVTWPPTTVAGSGAPAVAWIPSPCASSTLPPRPRSLIQPATTSASGCRNCAM